MKNNLPTPSELCVFEEAQNMLAKELESNSFSVCKLDSVSLLLKSINITVYWDETPAYRFLHALHCKAYNSLLEDTVVEIKRIVHGFIGYINILKNKWIDKEKKRRLKEILGPPSEPEKEFNTFDEIMLFKTGMPSLQEYEANELVPNPNLKYIK